MWRRTPIVSLVAHSPLCLRDAGRSSSSRGGTTRPKQVKAAVSTAEAVPSQPPNSSVNTTTDRNPNRSQTIATSTEAASPTATSSAAAGATPPVPLSSLVSTVDQLKEATRRNQHTLRNQEDAIQLLQQRFTLLERQVGVLESTAEGLRGKLGEVHRVVGEIVMGQRNTDLLIQQMERQQLNLRNATSDASAALRKKEGEKGTEIISNGVDAQRNVSTTGSPATTPQMSSATQRGTQTPSSANSNLTHRVAILEARVNQLTQDLFGADRIAAAASQLNIADSHSALSDTTAAVSAILASPSASSKRTALLRALQCHHAVSLFTDTTGATRVTSQCVRMHNIPLNMGAAEVREICVHHVCEGDSGGLVSCMVCCSPDVAKKAVGRSDSTRNAEPASKSKEKSTTAIATGGPPVYASQQQQQQSSRQQSKREEPMKGDGSVMNGNGTEAESTDFIPRGDSVAAIQPNTKSFEVVFASSALAVRALKVLNGLQLRPTMYADPIPLAVEPVVSADVLTALREAEASGREATNRE